MDRARQIAILGMVVSGILAIVKIAGGLIAGSEAVAADGMESATDVFSSGMVLLGLTLAARPADSNHPYGHGRVEILSGLLLGFFLFAAGCLISWHALTGPAEKAPPAAWAIWIMAGSIAGKLFLVTVKYRHGRRIRSSSLIADAVNDSVDVLSGVVALTAISLAVTNPGRFSRADHYGAFAVGLIVIVAAIRVAHDASMQLMDTMPDDESMNQIRRTALMVENVKGVEKCFARKTGLRYHVDLHLGVDAEISVRASHDIAQAVRERIRHDLDWVDDVLVHVEPVPFAVHSHRAD